jgi:putative heme-binding domain-containing protein
MIFDQYNELWLIDNQGGGNQVEELNLVQRGGFYGHNPEKYQSPVEIEATFELKTDIAPSGMTFNPTSNDFDSTGGDLFVSFYGPGERWNRGSIGRVRMSKAPDGTYLIEEFKVLEGLAKVSDLEFGFQGDLYTTLAGKTDYWYQELDEPDGAIYKIVYAPWVKPVIPEEVDNEVLLADVDILEEGRQLFLDRACNACHAIDGKTELLGPNLKDVGRNFSREELLEEIEDPSARIKPSMAPTRIIKKNGESLLGRVVSNNPEAIRIMITGNRIVDVPKNEIQKEEKVLVSMMYEGLLEGLAEQEVDALLTYLESLGSVNQ